MKLAGRLAESGELFREAYVRLDEANDHRGAFYAITNLCDWTEGYEAGGGAMLLAELARPRNAQPSVQRTTLMNDLGSALAVSGRMDEARKQLQSVPDGFLRTMICFYDGEWEAAEADLLQGVDILREVGHRSSLANRLHHIATVRMASDHLRDAEAALREEHTIAVDSGAVLIELRVVAELALICAQTRRAAAADQHIARAHAILSSGEDFGRKALRVVVAEAVLAAQRDAAATEGLVAKAARGYQERGLAWDEADAHVQTARALEARDKTAAEEHRQRATAIYLGLGAAERWSKRAETLWDSPNPAQK
jgi:hypothetical protein